MNTEGVPGQSAPKPLAEREDGRPNEEDPDLARVIELVERMCRRGEQPL